MTPDAPDIGYRLRFLREHVHPLDRGPYSFAELRSKLAKAGVKVSDSHLRAIFAGTVANPSFVTLTALADIFKVSVAVLSYDKQQRDEIESWITTVSDKLSTRNLAAARGLKRRNKLVARRATLLPDSEND